MQIRLLAITRQFKIYLLVLMLFSEVAIQELQVFKDNNVLPTNPKGSFNYNKLIDDSNKYFMLQLSKTLQDSNENRKKSPFKEKMRVRNA